MILDTDSRMSWFDKESPAKGIELDVIRDVKQNSVTGLRNMLLQK